MVNPMAATQQFWQVRVRSRRLRILDHRAGGPRRHRLGRGDHRLSTLIRTRTKERPSTERGPFDTGNQRKWMLVESRWAARWTGVRLRQRGGEERLMCVCTYSAHEVPEIHARDRQFSHFLASLSGKCPPRTPPRRTFIAFREMSARDSLRQHVWMSTYHRASANQIRPQVHSQSEETVGVVMPWDAWVLSLMTVLGGILLAACLVEDIRSSARRARAGRHRAERRQARS